MENYSLSDVIAVTRGDGMSGMGGWWMIILFAMIFGGGGFGFGGRGGNPVTESGLCDAMNFNNLENAVGRLSDQNAQQTAQITNGMAELGYDQLRSFNALQAQLAECCCTIQRGIDGANYNAAMNTAAINANTTAGIQKILDKLCADQTDALRTRVNQLELREAMCGVVRYPTTTSYVAANPFFGGCGAYSGAI